MKLTESPAERRHRLLVTIAPHVRLAHAKGEVALLVDECALELVGTLGQMFPTCGIAVRISDGQPIVRIAPPGPSLEEAARWVDVLGASESVEDSTYVSCGRWFQRMGAALLGRTTTAPRSVRQATVYHWVRRTFGAACAVPRERAARLFEEVAELCQVEAVPLADLHRLLDHVYGKPVGEAAQELGGVGTTLLAYAASRGLSADVAESEEVARVLAKDPEYFRARQTAKAEAGVARAVDVERPAAGEPEQAAPTASAKLVCGPEPHRHCPVIGGFAEQRFVCGCECAVCKRAWWDAGRPVLRDGKIEREAPK